MSWENVVTGFTDGPTLTAAARASCIPTASRITLPNSFFYPGRRIKFTLGGRISCAVIAPGTARFDICMGAGGGTIVFDTLALSMNTVAKVSVPWILDVTLVCRAVGATTLTNFFPTGYFASEIIVGSLLPTAGSNGFLNVPVGIPAVGAGMDNTVASTLDVFFTQTVATGSLTVHNYNVDAAN